MAASSVQDPKDGAIYPDPLTLNYNVFKSTEKPGIVELDTGNIERMWLLVAGYYGTAEYDDMLLSLNGIPHKNLLKEGSVFFIPTITDLESSFRKAGE